MLFCNFIRHVWHKSCGETAVNRVIYYRAKAIKKLPIGAKKDNLIHERWYFPVDISFADENASF